MDLVLHYFPETNRFRDRLASLAYERGHSSGLSEVENIFIDLIELDKIAAETYSTKQ